MASYERWQRIVDEATYQYALAKANYATERKALRSAKSYHKNLITVRQLIQETAKQIQTKAYTRIASVVTRCLCSIFESPYQFSMNFVERRGRTEVELSFKREGLEFDPLSASGGGVVDVAAFALRLAALLLSRPSLRRFVVLDEPFRFLSSEHRESVRKLLETLSVELDIQFLVVTHIQELKTGKVIEL